MAIEKNSEKMKALDAVLMQIEKQYGKGSIMRLGDEAGNTEIDVIPSGCLTLDLALGIGGFPRGRIIEIYGPESSGKTTVALHAIAETQKLGGVAAFIDAEHALDPVYAKHLGVDLENLRKLTAIVNKSHTCVIFINQLREKVGVMFGNPEVTPGGKALKFYASIRIDVRKMDTLKDAEGAMGNRTKAKIVKNKLAPPFKQAEFDIVFGEGISQEGCIMDMGIQFDIIGKSGAWFSYNGEKVANGREKMRQFLKDNPEISNEIQQKIRAAAKGAADVVEGGADEE